MTRAAKPEQAVSPRVRQRDLSEQSAKDASKIAAWFQSNKRRIRDREFEQDCAQDKRRSRRGEETDEFHTRSNERRALSSRLTRQRCDRNKGTQAHKPQSALQRITESLEYKGRCVECEMRDCDRRILARSFHVCMTT